VVADVKDFYALSRLVDEEDHAVDMRFIAVKEMPERVVFVRDRVALGMMVEARNCIEETDKPAFGWWRYGRSNEEEDFVQIGFRTRHGSNEVCHTSRESRRKIPWRDGLHRGEVPQGPGECLLPR